MKCCLVFALAFTAAAHDFYLLPDRFFVDAGEKVTVHFRNGDSFPESEIAPVMDRLREPSLITPFAMHSITHLAERGRLPKKKKEKPAALEVDGAVAIAEKGTLVLIARTTPYPLEMPAAEFSKYLHQEGLDAVVAWRASHGESEKPGRERYAKFAKSLIQSGPEPDDFYKQKTSLALEFIPEVNPLALKAGESFSAILLFQGQPAKGAQVSLSSAPAEGVATTTVIGRTDAEGRITGTLASAGRYRLHAEIMGLCADKGLADWESLSASLTFAIR